MIPRIDLAFSYWIFAWYLLYIFKITTYNPFFFLIIALIENLIYLALLIYYKNPILYIFQFIFINFFIKVLPILTLRNTKFNYDDIVAGIILFFIYIGWMWFNNKLHINTIKKYINSIKKGVPASPILSYLYKNN